MVWIRWECKTPEHQVIGLLADELSIRRAEAHGLYSATCCGFGNHQRDGMAAGVSRSSLERWADWQGKPGKWAAAFLAHCLETEEGQKDPVGSVRGWWRQKAWLARQERDNARRKPGGGFEENPPETQVGSVREIRGDDDGDGDKDARPKAPSVDPDADPVAASAEAARLIGRFAGRPDRWAVYRFLERCPDREQVAWAQRLSGYLQGLGFPAGMMPTLAQVATACSDYSQTPPNPVHFRAFILRLMQGGKPRTGPRTPPPIEEQLEAAHRWAAKGD